MSGQGGINYVLVVFSHLTLDWPFNRVICPRCGYRHDLCVNPPGGIEAAEFPIAVPIRCAKCRVPIRVQFDELEPGQLLREPLAATSPGGRKVISYLEHMISKSAVRAAIPPAPPRPEGWLMLEPRQPAPRRGLLMRLADLLWPGGDLSRP